MRHLLLLLVFLASSQAPALAQENRPAHSDTKGDAQGAQGDTWGERETPENFVRSKGPAESDEPYNWVQMGYAGLVILAMVGFMVWLVRRNTREKQQR